MSDFKSGDKFVFVKDQNPEIMTVQFVTGDGKVEGVYCSEPFEPTEIRLATALEIKAGRRLP